MFLHGGVRRGRSGDGLFSIAQGHSAVGRQAVPHHIHNAMLVHEPQRLLVTPEKAGPRPCHAASGGNLPAGGDKTRHGTPVVADEVPHAVPVLRGNKADRSEIPAPHYEVAVHDAGHGATSRSNGIDTAVPEHRLHIQNKTLPGPAPFRRTQQKHEHGQYGKTHKSAANAMRKKPFHGTRLRQGVLRESGLPVRTGPADGGRKRLGGRAGKRAEEHRSFPRTALSRYAGAFSFQRTGNGSVRQYARQNRRSVCRKARNRPSAFGVPCAAAAVPLPLRTFMPPGTGR